MVRLRTDACYSCADCTGCTSVARIMESSVAEAAAYSLAATRKVHVEFDHTAFLPSGYQNEEVDSDESSDDDDINWEEIGAEDKPSTQPATEIGKSFIIGCNIPVVWCFCESFIAQKHGFDGRDRGHSETNQAPPSYCGPTPRSRRGVFICLLRCLGFRPLMSHSMK